MFRPHKYKPSFEVFFEDLTDIIKDNNSKKVWPEIWMNFIYNSKVHTKKNLKTNKKPPFAIEKRNQKNPARDEVAWIAHSVDVWHYDL